MTPFLSRYLVKLPLRVNVLRLVDWYEAIVKPLEWTLQDVDKQYGGWSILSGDGTVQDGWAQYGKGYKIEDGKEVLVADRPFKNMQHYTVPTPICIGYMAEVIHLLRDFGFHSLFRVRTAKIIPPKTLAYHVDAGSENVRWRVHIPILTDPKCVMGFFADGQEETIHLPADGGVYLMNTNVLHKVDHFGSVPRVHIHGITLETPETLNLQRPA